MSTTLPVANHDKTDTTIEKRDHDDDCGTSSSALNNHTTSQALVATATEKPITETSIPKLAVVSGSISPFNPTSDQAQETILQLLELQSTDILFDLGCGDGRLLQKAVQSIPDIRCIGIDIDPIFINRGIESTRTNLSIEQQRRIQLRIGSILNLKSRYNTDDVNGSKSNDDDATINENSTELPIDNNSIDNNNTNDVIGSDCTNLTLHDDATAVYIFLLPKAIKQIQDMLNEVIKTRRQRRQQYELEQNEGTTQKEVFQVVTYMFQIHDWTPTVIDRTTKAGAPIYLYRFDI